MVNKEVIKSFINIIPSKDLKEAYKKDFRNDIYPNWDIEDIMSLIHNFMWHCNLEDVINVIIDVADNDENEERKEKFYKFAKELKHKGRNIKSRFLDGFDKYVPVKNLFRAGDLIKYVSRGKPIFGLVGNFDYEKDDEKFINGQKYFDESDLVYYSHAIMSDVDVTNPYDIYACHDHPSKLIVEKASENELPYKMKKYLTFLRNNILYLSEDEIKKMFDEYDNRSKRNVY